MIDMHVHFFPPGVFQAIWRYFETPSNGLWNIKYKLYGGKLIQTLRMEGVKRFTSLLYAHKPGLDTLKPLVTVYGISNINCMVES